MQLFDLVPCHGLLISHGIGGHEHRGGEAQFFQEGNADLKERLREGYNNKGYVEWI